jgi:hypothetical protein
MRTDKPTPEPRDLAALLTDDALESKNVVDRINSMRDVLLAALDRLQKLEKKS